MDVLLSILCCVIVLSVLVFLHEGGHFLAAKMFGVRVTEFMLGLPGPHVGFTHKGTKFGVTAIPLGGYAKVCGMEPGNLKPHLEEVLAYVYKNGTATVSQVSKECMIPSDEAGDVLEELTEWGSICRNTKHEPEDTYYAAALNGYARGQARPVKDTRKLFESEYDCQYRSLPFWKRSIILLAGIFINLLFAMIIFIILYTLVGFDVKYSATDEIKHVTMNPLQAIQYGFMYMGAVVQAVLKLFNPVTAAETVQNSTSLIGIAVISKTAAEQGICAFLEFMAMISVSLGIMNLLPIPPLDGGRFIVEIIQVITRKNVSERALTAVSFVGIVALFAFFIFMINQDIQRFILGG